MRRQALREYKTESEIMDAYGWGQITDDERRELLDGLGLELTDQDILSLPRDTPLVPGMVLTVERHESCQEVYTISIPPETEYRPDDTLPWGQEAVLAEGIPGEMRLESWEATASWKIPGRISLLINIRKWNCILPMKQEISW